MSIQAPGKPVIGDDPMSPQSVGRRFRFARAALLVALLAFGFSAAHVSPFDEILEKESIVSALSHLRTSPTGWIAFIALFAIAASLALPVTPLMLAAGYLFGLGYGMLVNWIASCLAAIPAYGLARWLGGDVLEALFRRRIQGLRSSGFVKVLYLRLIPVYPFAGVNFPAGAACVRFRSYVGATLIGMIPSCFTFTLFASSAHDAFSERNAATVTMLVLSVALLLGSLYFPFWMRRKRRAAA